jgi:hypothetical protein
MLPVNRAERGSFYSSNPETSMVGPSKVPSHIRPISEEREPKRRDLKATVETIHTWSLTRGKCQYNGPLVDGKMHGEGTLITERGDRFMGVWQKGVLLGRITVVTQNAIRMTGNWNDGWQGKVKSVSKTETYEGTFKSGGENFLERDHGTLIRGSTRYMGQWSNNSFEGTIFYDDHSLFKRYTGKELGHCFVGPGELELKNGEVISGQFVRGDCLYGKIKKSAYSYEGELQNFQPHGSGTLRTNLETYTGKFHSGKKHGRGKELVDGFAIEGIWENGKLTTIISKNHLTDDELMNDLEAWLSEC